MTSRVPLISGQIPNCGSANSGFQSPSVMNAPSPTSWKNSIVSLSSATTIPSVVSTETDRGAKAGPP